MKTAQYVGLTLNPAIDSGGGFVFNAEAQRRQGAEGDGGVCIRLLPPRIACWSHRLSHRGGDGSSPGEELSPSWRSGGLQPAWRVRFRKTVEKATVGDGRELIGRSQTGALRAVRGEVKDGLGSSPRPSPRLARRGGKARGGRRIGGIDYARQLTGWFGISRGMARQMRIEFAGGIVNRLYCRQFFSRSAVLFFALAMFSLAACGRRPATMSEAIQAVRSGDVEAVKSFLNDNSDLVFSRDCEGNTLLHFAAAKGQKDIASILLANNAAVDARGTNGMTPLHWAANNGHTDMAKFLLANKAAIDAKEINGMTPLQFASVKNLIQVVSVLVASNADVNAKSKDGMTPLHIAATYGNKDVAEFLLLHHANVNARINGGETPLHAAALNDHKNVAELLISAKAEIEAREQNGGTPLHFAAVKGCVDIAGLLLSNKAAVNSTNIFGWTPLHAAAKSGQKDFVSFLLANKADVNAVNSEGQTPLGLAVKNEHNDVAELLRQYGGHE